jgi:hypothetical protein
VTGGSPLLEDPQVQAAGVFVDVPGADDPARSVATPVAFESSSRPVAGPPGIGADTDAVLAEIGVGAGEKWRCPNQRSGSVPMSDIGLPRDLAPVSGGPPAPPRANSPEDEPEHHAKHRRQGQAITPTAGGRDALQPSRERAGRHMSRS